MAKKAFWNLEFVLVFSAEASGRGLCPALGEAAMNMRTLVVALHSLLLIVAAQPALSLPIKGSVNVTPYYVGGPTGPLVPDPRIDNDFRFANTKYLSKSNLVF